MEDKIKKIEALVYNEGSFLDKLLEGEGVDVDLLVELRSLIIELTGDLKDSDSLPRTLVSALFDLNRGIIVSLESYEDEEEFAKLIELEEELLGLTQNCIGLTEDKIQARLNEIN